MFLLIITGLTVFMALQVPRLQLDYGYSGMMPDSDSVSIKLEEFKEVFGGDATIFLLGVQDSHFFTLDKFNDWKQLKNDLLEIDGIETVLSISDAIEIQKNNSGGKFEFNPIFPKEIISQNELDSLVEIFEGFPIYKDPLYSPQSNIYMMILTMDSIMINNWNRELIVKRTQELAGQWGDKYNRELHFSGLPYLRSQLLIMIKAELLKFIYLAAFVTFILLLIFFRSLKAVIPSVLVVGMGVLWEQCHRI